MSIISTPIEYKFDAPLLITEHELLIPAPEFWKIGEKWVQYLTDIGKKYKAVGKILGIVIPLELKFDQYPRQFLHGVELLTWLRWSAEESQRYVPVLAVSFQPLESILRRTLNLLLIGSGTQHVQLPDQSEKLQKFISNVRTPNSPELRANADELYGFAAAAGNSARRKTYHDLANDHYAAHRLWVGYRSALNGAAINPKLKKTDKTTIKQELDRVSNIRHQKLDEKIEILLNQPYVKQYLALVKQQPGTPEYPVIDNAEQVMLRHIKQGLPSKTRILLVDDEFDKGLADVLLQILFKQSKFTYKKGSTEWVYSEETSLDKPLARLVCVNSTELAEHWLTHWGDLEKTPDKHPSSEQDWLRSWAQVQGKSILTQQNKLSEDDKKDIFCKIDCCNGRHQHTVVLLDLRLDPGDQKDTYKPEGLKSIQLRNRIKQKRDPAPVIMLTASRQILNYAIIMENSEKADGWLMKEGPDISPNEENSARSVHYLLQRLHRFADRREWYREEMDWKPGWIDMYDAFRSNPDWEERLAAIQTAATKCFQTIQNTHDNDFATTSIKDWIDAQLEIPGGDTSEQILARRLVIYGMLLLTGNINNGKLKVNPWNFSAQMPGSKSRKKDIKYPSDILNFDNLCNGGYGALATKMLLKEEYQWLITQFPKNGHPEIYHYLNNVLQEKFPANQE